MLVKGAPEVARLKADIYAWLFDITTDVRLYKQIYRNFPTNYYIDDILVYMYYQTQHVVNRAYVKQFF